MDKGKCVARTQQRLSFPSGIQTRRVMPDGKAYIQQTHLAVQGWSSSADEARARFSVSIPIEGYDRASEHEADLVLVNHDRSDESAHET
jgi:hypothetical protein